MPSTDNAVTFLPPSLFSALLLPLARNILFLSFTVKNTVSYILILPIRHGITQLCVKTYRVATYTQWVVVATTSYKLAPPSALALTLTTT